MSETKTPAAIDTELAAIYEKAATWILRLGNAGNVIRKYAGRTGLTRYEARALESAEKAAATAKIEIEKIEAEMAPLETQYTGWNRYFLVTNTNGHVHRGRNCSTCYATTTYSWETELSDCDETEMVATYGEMACTVCFPEAPAKKGYGDGTSYMAKLGAAEKAAKDAEKAAKKAAKAASEVIGTEGRREGKVIFKTERAAEITANGHLAHAIELTHGIENGYGMDHWGELVTEYAGKGMKILAALAAKHGTSTEDELTRLSSKIWKKAKKELKAAGRNVA